MFAQILVLLTKDGLAVVTGVDALEVASAVVLVVVGGEGEREGQAPEAEENQWVEVSPVDRALYPVSLKIVMKYLLKEFQIRKGLCTTVFNISILCESDDMKKN